MDCWNSLRAIKIYGDFYVQLIGCIFLSGILLRSGGHFGVPLALCAKQQRTGYLHVIPLCAEKRK